MKKRQLKKNKNRAWINKLEAMLKLEAEQNGTQYRRKSLAKRRKEPIRPIKCSFFVNESESLLIPERVGRFPNVPMQQMR